MAQSYTYTPNPVVYGSSFNLTFTDTTGAIDGNNTYNLTDANSIVLASYNNTNQVFVSSELNNPFGLAFDSSGYLYVASSDGTISKISSNGSTITTFASGFLGLNALAFDSSGYLYVASSDGTISKISSNGSTITPFASGLMLPFGLAFDSSGYLYVANNGNDTISKISPSGVVSTFVSSGLSFPYGLAFDSSGYLYVANYGRGSGNGTISKISPDGTTITPFASGFSYPPALAFDSSGYLYVANGDGTISKISSNGSTITTFASGLNGPWGLTFDSSDYLYVANIGNSTISLFATSMLPFTNATSNTLLVNSSNSLNIKYGSNTLNTSVINVTTVPLMSFGITLNSAGSVTLPIDGTVTNVVIDWGDSTGSTTTSSPKPSHSYSSAGSYTINITSGSFTALSTSGLTAGNLFSSKLTSFYYNTKINALTNFNSAFQRVTTNFTLYFAPNVTNNVTSMNNMFQNATTFNQSVSSFDTSNVTDMSAMFEGAYAFNNGDTTDSSNIPLTFNTSKVINMGYMFTGTSFNQTLPNFNTNLVSNMDGMFGDSKFNQSISSFNTSNVTSMANMFANAIAFNQPVSSFNTSNVRSMYFMFSDAKTFNQDVSSFNISKVTNMGRMLASWGFSSFSSTNYNKLLIAWANQAPNIQPNVTLGVKTVYTTVSALSARNTLISTPYSWNIIDGGSYIPAPTISTISPSGGPVAGGTSVTITGTNFYNGTSLLTGAFGNNLGIVNSISSDGTTINLTIPASTTGTNQVNVIVTTQSGSATSTGGFTYLNAPTISTISPSSGLITGGTSVTITGTNFVSGSTVTFGGTSASSVTFVSSTELTVITPAKTAGAVDVVVTTNGGSATSTNGFTYLNAPTISIISPSSGSTTGGTSVTIDGTNFVSGATTVTFGGTSASVTFVSSTQLTVTTPLANSTGSVNVVVTTNGGSATSTDGFTYVSAPTITSLSQYSGTTAGGTSITIYGTNFVSGATTVTFGGTSASVTFVSSTQLTVTTPAANSTGSVNVVVTTNGGSATSTNGFTYSFISFGITLNSAGSVTLPIAGTVTNVVIDWGDSTGSTTTSSPNPSHSYSSPGSYTINITSGSFTALSTSGVAAGNLFYSKLTSFYYNTKINALTNFNSAFKSVTTNFTLYFAPNVTNNVTNMSFMFFGAYNFNWLLSNLNTNAVTDMSYMFYNASTFNNGENVDSSNYPLTFNTTNVTNMSAMFQNAYVFNQSVSSFDTTVVANMSNMFSGATAFNQSLPSTFTEYVTNISGMFQDASYNDASISNLFVSNVTNMSNLFAGNTAFDQGLSSWDTSNVTDMSSMFQNASAFNQDISTWDMIKVINISNMFDGATAYNQPLPSAFTANITDMSGMFQNTSYNQDVSQLDVSKVTNMSNLFAGNTAFNQHLPSNFTASVTDMSGMFQNASYNDASISNLIVSNVTNMSNLFAGNTVFNQDLSLWDTSSVNNMSNMFNGATAFNNNNPQVLLSRSEITFQPFSVNSGISSWNTSNVTDMSYMFYNASSFNDNLSSWITNIVTDMSYMFYGASAFDQDISTFFIPSLIYATEMLTGSGLSSTNYNNLLVSWGTTQTAAPYIIHSNVPFGAGTIQYTTVSALTARNILTGTYNWTITDGGNGIPEPTILTISPSSGLIAGGTIVTITGTNFYDGNNPLTVEFGTNNFGTVTDITSDGTQLTVTTPHANNGGPVNVVVTTDSGSSIQSIIFTYISLPPTITSISPPSGTHYGGTSVTITGTNFYNPLTVLFGYYSASITSISQDGTTVSVTTPEYIKTIGFVNVTVTNSIGSVIKLKGYFYTRAPCFHEDTQILTNNGYIQIKNLRKGDLIQTLNHDYVPISMIGHSQLYNPSNEERTKDRLYKCTKDAYPEITNDLILTGMHAILVDKYANQAEKVKNKKTANGNQEIENKYCLLACVDERTVPYNVEGTYTIYNLALEHHDENNQYGIYANGLLVETASQKYIKEMMTLIE